MTLLTALKKEYTEEQEHTIGLKIVEIFNLKKNRTTGRYHLGGTWCGKTPIGLCRTFRGIAQQIDEGDGLKLST
jgi:hypothetical protein